MNTEYTISNTTRDGTTKEFKEQGVGPHYWASGQVINEWNKYPSEFPDREITDAPMQIIKFGEFCRITGGEDILLDIRAGLKSIATHWVRSLHKRNKGGAYAFPRIREEETGKFYLADHALIWWASKSLEELGLDLELEAPTDDSQDASEQRTINYSSDEIKANFIKRFTMENPASKTRMIAISRSSAETRFSLLTRETVLFYAMDLGLFDAEVNERGTSTNPLTESSSYYDNTKNTNEISNETNETLADLWGNVIEVWTNTVDYQTQLEDQNDAHWNHPLQFALSIIMSTKIKCANSRLAAWMFEYSRTILLKSSSANGLFPGQLDIYKRPILFDGEIMRDTYWQSTFEVPFILWKYHKSPPIATGSPISIPESISSDIRALENIIKRLPSINNRGISNNAIDQGKVVTLSDEWLYNTLDCFKYNIDLSNDKIGKLLRKYKTNTQTADMIVIRRAAQKIQDTTAEDTIDRDQLARYTMLQDIEEDILGYIIDIPRKSDKRQDTLKRVEIRSIQSLNQIFLPKRTTKNAKKRLLHFSRATDKTALICYISAIEHPDISAFFDKHMDYNKHFHEETNAVLNLWVTELHLSFYQIISQGKNSGIISIPDFEYYRFPGSTNPKGGHYKQISRAVMSFRFDGDFFDRHWTCHFFEFNPYRIYDDKIFDITTEKITGSLKADPWKQRRVLELVLFGKILQEMVRCSQDLLDEIRGRILEGFQKTGTRTNSSSTFLDSIHLFDETTSNIFKSAKTSWNIFQYILQAVEEDLCENLTTIELWTKREERPEYNRPQWTLNKERNYRGAIYMLQKSNELLIQDLKLCYSKVKSLNTSLTKGLEFARDNWEFESNDDIRLFTYVTVVFLPISFATGVFSMSSAPTKETLNSMITTAGLALLATVIALLYAKDLYGTIVQPFFTMLRLVLRIPLYILGLVFRLTYLILISLFSILPRQWIYLLRHYLISPTAESSSRPYSLAYVQEHFLDAAIKGKTDKIKEKLEWGETLVIVDKEEKEDKVKREEEERARYSSLSYRVRLYLSSLRKTIFGRGSEEELYI